MKNQNFDYDVALSFAGEDREYVEQVATILKASDVRVFYDSFEETKLWGKDLYEYLDEIYKKKAKYCIIFISKYYAEKLWTTHERKSAQERAFSESEEYILPARFDSTNIPGIRSTVGYINLIKYSPKQFCELIRQKLTGTEKEKIRVQNDSITYKFQFYPNLLIKFNHSDLQKALTESLITFKIFEDYGQTYHWPEVIAHGSSDKIKNGISFNHNQKESDPIINYNFKVLKDGSLHLLSNIKNDDANPKQEFNFEIFLHDLIAFIFLSCKWIEYFKRTRSIEFKGLTYALKASVPENTVLRCGMNLVEASYYRPIFGTQDEIEEMHSITGYDCKNDLLIVHVLDHLINSIISEFYYKEGKQVRFANMKIETIKQRLSSMRDKLST
jgi:TIR domain